MMNDFNSQFFYNLSCTSSRHLVVVVDKAIASEVFCFRLPLILASAPINVEGYLKVLVLWQIT